MVCYPFSPDWLALACLCINKSSSDCVNRGLQDQSRIYLVISIYLAAGYIYFPHMCPRSSPRAPLLGISLRFLNLDDGLCCVSALSVSGNGYHHLVHLRPIWLHLNQETVLALNCPKLAERNDIAFCFVLHTIREVNPKPKPAPNMLDIHMSKNVGQTLSHYLQLAKRKLKEIEAVCFVAPALSTS